MPDRNYSQEMANLSLAVCCSTCLRQTGRYEIWARISLGRSRPAGAEKLFLTVFRRVGPSGYAGQRMYPFSTLASDSRGAWRHDIKARCRRGHRIDHDAATFETLARQALEAQRRLVL